jgi:hypothetical protein
MSALSGWENFYVIVGSSAGALIGLQFVVITLIAEIPIEKDMERAGSAFATPTIVHFGSVLLVSAGISAPWHGIAGARRFSGEYWAWPEWCTSWSWRDARDYKPPTRPSWRIGYFIFCCPSRPMQR